MTTESEPRRLYREPDDRKIAGVCSGIGDYLGVDPTVVRLMVVVIALSTWMGIGMYIIAALVVSQRPADVPRVRSPRPLLPESSTTPVPLRRRTEFSIGSPNGYLPSLAPPVPATISTMPDVAG